MDLKEELFAILDEISKSEEIELSDIPSIDLYVDQITTLFDKKLGYLKRNEETILTKTMINNYVKGKVLAPPNKKKYSKEHIIFLILIYNLKQALSINDITLLLTPVLEMSEDDNDYSVETLYSSFLDIKRKENEDFKEKVIETLNDLFDNEDIGSDEDQVRLNLILTVLSLVSQANSLKRLAEKIIDNYFSTHK